MSFDKGIYSHHYLCLSSNTAKFSIYIWKIFFLSIDYIYNKKIDGSLSLSQIFFVTQEYGELVIYFYHYRTPTG